jgi:hypothetical protein
MSFKRLDPEDFLISADSVTAGAWTGNIPTLTQLFTSSVQVAGSSGNYYVSVYQTGSTLSTAETQFNISFGNINGLGSLLYDSGISGKSPSSTVYGQFQNIILGDENNNFIFGDTTPINQSFYALTINRARFKGNIFPGTLDLRLRSGSSTLRLTDNSNDTSVVSFNEAGRVYQIVSGSNGRAASGTGYTSTSGSYGLFLPDIGTIILNASALDLPVANGGINLSSSYTSNTSANNPGRLYTAISGGANFTLNSQENITSDYVFIRARNSEFNYSENPSFISGSNGEVLYSDFINAPQTFITTVGLYNDANELLAVAKLSKPLKKDFTKEALIRVKLDF